MRLLLSCARKVNTRENNLMSMFCFRRNESSYVRLCIDSNQTKSSIMQTGDASIALQVGTQHNTTQKLLFRPNSSNAIHFNQTVLFIYLSIFSLCLGSMSHFILFFIQKTFLGSKMVNVRICLTKSMSQLSIYIYVCVCALCVCIWRMRWNFSYHIYWSLKCFHLGSIDTHTLFIRQSISMTHYQMCHWHLISFGWVWRRCFYCSCFQWYTQHTHTYKNCAILCSHKSFIILMVQKITT